MDIRRYPLISEQVSYDEVEIIVRNLQAVLSANIAGDIVEFGCYVGTTSLFIQRQLVESGSGRAFHVYDSFSGLPPKQSADESPAGIQFRAGELSASKAGFIQNFRRAHLPLPVIHKGWFSGLESDAIPDKIAFAFLDGDFYQSLAESFGLITPSLQHGATIIVDDYQSESLPGAKKAVDEWLNKHPGYRCQTEKSLAVLTTR